MTLKSTTLSTMISSENNPPLNSSVKLKYSYGMVHLKPNWLFGVCLSIYLPGLTLTQPRANSNPTPISLGVRNLVSCMEGLTEDWGIPVIRRPSSCTFRRWRTIFVRGGVISPAPWLAGSHTLTAAVTWPGWAPWSRSRSWWRCPIIA